MNNYNIETPVQFSFNYHDWMEIISGDTYETLEKLNNSADWWEQVFIYRDYCNRIKNRYEYTDKVNNDDKNINVGAKNKDKGTNTDTNIKDEFIYPIQVIISNPYTIAHYFMEAMNSYQSDRCQHAFANIINGGNRYDGWYYCTMLYATKSESLVGSLATFYGGIEGCSTEHKYLETKLDYLIEAAKRTNNQLELDFHQLIKITRFSDSLNSNPSLSTNTSASPKLSTELIDSILLDPSNKDLVNRIIDVSHMCDYEGSYIDHFWNIKKWFHRAMTLNHQEYIPRFVFFLSTDFLLENINPDTEVFFNACLDELDRQYIECDDKFKSKYKSFATQLLSDCFEYRCPDEYARQFIESSKYYTPVV